ncbi:hypothetical protein TSOC_004452 [Tetrabaena socialis]|uniref:Uncharacterized protein n=1 Tax=Tetrabaena socialis TaxID=47790 RepID=A0A2J8A8V2_9CHLO|nr:hypothetical protein TSOC_004452 [Tetrabaena socialis]|eukprot:PNH08947.1 hypothetical protein TSOC_004452 [Tetrabaena socialis]
MDPEDGCHPSDVPGWTEAFLARCSAESYDATYGNLANLMHALAMLGLRPGEAWLRGTMARVELTLPDFGHTTLSKVLWALPRLAQDGGAEPEQLAAWQQMVKATLRTRLGFRPAGLLKHGRRGRRGRGPRLRPGVDSWVALQQGDAVAGSEGSS